MKYFIRAVKYFFYLAIILVLVIYVLILLKLVGSDPATLFRNGTDSFWQIGIMLALFAAVYPRFGFSSRDARIPGSFDEIKDGVREYMDMRGYKLERTEGESMTYRLRSPLNRLTRMLEDRITLSRTIDGFSVEGPTKDIVRIATGLESKFVDNTDDDEQQQQQQ